MDKGRVTLPTDLDIIPQTLEVMERLGVDALRDCDGTEFPEELLNKGAKVYATYFTTRKDNKWAEENPDEVQQMYLVTNPETAIEDILEIELMKDFYKPQFKVNTMHDITKWWEVIDRTTGGIVPVSEWNYNENTGKVIINAKKFHEYTVSFLAFIMWDPVHMYNYLTNDWKDVEHQLTYDVRQPKTKKYVKEKLAKWCEDNPNVDVVRFTTFFHQFTLNFNDEGKEKFVDWFGYSASVSPYVLEQFEEEVGYKFRPEYIIDEGYQNNTFRIPKKEYKDFMDFQQREVAKLAKELVDIVHSHKKEAMMFLGDHWIGTEPFGKYFNDIGLDSVVGSVGNGTTLRLISDIEGVKYTEGRFLPYFFPDTFYEGGDPKKEAVENWITARRAILRSPVDRIGYGGYLKLALNFPDFMSYIEDVCNEFRTLYSNIGDGKPYAAPFKVAVLNSWGKIRSWGTYMVAHALWNKKCYSYGGILEALSGMPFDVKFISFDDIREDKSILDDVGVIINAGSAYTANSGGENWLDVDILTAIKEFVAEGGGFIGVGEPTAYEKNGRYFQLASVLGVDKELGFSLSTDRYNWKERPHFITEECNGEIDFGEGMKDIYALKNANVIVNRNENIQLATNDYYKGRGVYISGIPYSFQNSRLLYRAIFFAAGKENEMKKWYSDNINVEVHAYPNTNKYCVVNNTYEPQKTVVYKGDNTKYNLDLEANEIMWFDI
ncbi:1,3-beta-galactosyl-N-acetylhexosamine phosphorylase [Vallitalea longa]|uniref:1,3-beta-galactosyl-N-acetylhexosamine phosphorylase n=1 Tax=Vallitalea longa TaxID=2936439 RepID=A0A9W5YCK3_9FIRM|nr:1,3-beta-galactosyl-N-acetylhexosamine phosphorylase [Vallitalea longa]GKX31507.1 1,3-beta-galactosyl-N-acetylhexosamine phosphorylase [Vallitalea longa]